MRNNQRYGTAMRDSLAPQRSAGTTFREAKISYRETISWRAREAIGSGRGVSRETTAFNVITFGLRVQNLLSPALSSGCAGRRGRQIAIHCRFKDDFYKATCRRALRIAFAFLLLLLCTTLTAVAQTNGAPRLLSLSDCIQIALQHNFDVQIARRGPEFERAALRAAYGIYEPALNLSGVHEHNNTGDETNHVDLYRADVARSEE